MPLFSRHADPVQQPAPQAQPVYEEPPRKHGLFGSQRAAPQPQPQPQAQPVYEEQPKRHGLFGSRRHSPTPATNGAVNGTHAVPAGAAAGTTPVRRSTDATSLSTNSSHRGSLLRRSFGNGNNNLEEMDPTIVQARERVMGAEAAEAEADRALMAARESVREAREHVRRLELEAQEEARRARIKQQHAKEVSKRGKALGRTFLP